MKQLDKAQVKPFILGGKAIFTLKSGKTGTHYTYKMERCEEDNNLYFIHLLTGPDNMDDYTYIGCYFTDNHYFACAKRWKAIPPELLPGCVRAIRYTLNNIDHLPDNLYVYHEGRCCVCGRRLTTPESIERGVGPECARRIE